MTTDRPIMKLLEGRRRAMAVLSVVSLLGGVLEAGFLIIITRAAFAVTNDETQVEIPALGTFGLGATVGASLVLVTLRMLVGMFSNWESARLLSEVSANVRIELAEAFLDSSWSVQQHERAGQLQELLSAYAERAGGVISNFIGGVAAAFNLLALVALAIIVDPAASVLVVVTIFGLAAVLWPVRRIVERRSRRTAAARMEFAASLSEISQVGMEVHVFNVQPTAKAEVRRLIEENRERQQALSFLQGIVPTLYAGLAYLVMAGAVAFVAAADSSNLATLGASMLLMLRSLFYGQTLQTTIVSVSAARPFIAGLHEQLETYRSAAVADTGEPVSSVGAISLSDVSFEYIEGQAVLHDIDVTIPSREVVGVIGPSGSGKSTMVQLMLGLRQPTAGRVLADGRDISTFSRHHWARRVTFVPQTPHLVSGTVADNIRFMRQDVSDADVERAARLAHLHDDVVGWPEGYERDVGPRGSNLSGGQQQRLCIARALVERPDVIILDEPTSALDGRSEGLIRQTLDELRRTMTVIIIAHRLSTLAVCDRIMIIEEGRLRAFGTPEELEQSSSFYREALLISGIR